VISNWLQVTANRFQKWNSGILIGIKDNLQMADIKKKLKTVNCLKDFY
jgi:hypothetical protein